MKAEYINALIRTVMSAIHEHTGIPLNQGKVSTVKGMKIEGRLGILYRFTGEIHGTMFIDISDPLYRSLLDKIAPDWVTKRGYLGGESQLKNLADSIAENAQNSLTEKGWPCEMQKAHFIHEGESSYMFKDVYYLYVPLYNEQFGTIKMRLVGSAQSYFNNDAMLFCHISESMVQQAILDFVPRGFIIYKAENERKLDELISTEKVDFLFIDDTSTKNMLDKIQVIREKSVNPDIKTIIFTDKTVEYLMSHRKNDYRLIGIIKKNLSTEEIMSKLKEIVSRTGIKDSERRKEIRYYFEPAEAASATFLMPNSDALIQGTLSNISIGGMTFIMNSPRQKEVLNPKTNLRQITIKLPDQAHYLITDGMVTFRRDTKLGVQFVGMLSKSTNILSRFINSRTTHSII